MYFLPTSILVCLIFIVSCSGDGSSNLVVQTKYGKVRGITQTVAEGRTLDSFLGIPYAASTNGRNRFAPPKERESWNDVLDATSFSRPCYQVLVAVLQKMDIASKVPPTEDCLKLNIWVPKPRPKKSAVMVWFHGGGFTCGSTDLDIYNGATLAAHEDIIVVSVNYRLSAFGFLYLNHPEAPGNVGLMDQAFALQWVQKNIKSFGGDPKRVTIFGESAGSASVGFHLVAPSSLELFKNAIMQSGSASDIWTSASVKTAISSALLLAERAGCPTQEANRENTIRCLQELDADKLSSVLLTIGNNAAPVTFSPIIDGKFLPNAPSNLLSDGKFCGEKNLIIGNTAQDGSFLLTFFPHLELKDETVYTEEQITSMMAAFSERNTVISGAKLDLVKYMYTDWEANADDRIAARSQLLNFFTDRFFQCGSFSTAEKVAAKGNKVFVYSFDHVMEGPNAFMKVPKWAAPAHGDDIPFVFGHTLKGKNSQEIRFAKQIMRYWANFAKNGHPNDDYLKTWPAYTPQDKLRLHLNSKNFTVKKSSRLRECALWDNVFPKIIQHSNKL